jgi:hypothetical protein
MSRIKVADSMTLFTGFSQYLHYFLIFFRYFRGNEREKRAEFLELSVEGTKVKFLRKVGQKIENS